MATYVVNETPGGNDASSSLSDDGKVTYKAKRSFQISADTVGLDAEFVKQELQAIGELPYGGAAHPANSLMRCRTPAVVRVSPIFFTATVDYASFPIPEGSDGDGIDNPFDIPATVNWRSVYGTAEVDEDYDGNPIANPGTDEPVTGVTRRTLDMIAIITRNFTAFNPQVFQDQFGPFTNSDEFLGYPAGRAQIQSINSDESDYEGVPLYKVTCEILFRTPYQTTDEKAWYHRRALKGFIEVKTGVLGTYTVKAVDDEGQLATQPVYLDETGARLDPGALPIWVDTKLYGSAAYSAMGFFT